jgi:hypothetical protein
VSFKKVLAKLLIFSVLEIGALCGVPMSPRQIEKLMQVMNETRVVRVQKKDRPGE